MKIGDIAKQSNLPASTIRYYESIGLLPAVQRRSGRRVYDASVLNRLKMIQVAKQAGWRLDEIGRILNSDAQGGHFGDAWRSLAQQKLVELDALIAQAEAMKVLIHRGMACGCVSAETCDLLAI